VLSALQDAPQRFTSRNEFTAELARRGVDEALGRWLAKNLVREADGLRFALDLAAMRDLLSDYDQTDLWPLIEAPPPGVAVRVVVGGRSRTIAPPDRVRLQAAAAAGAIELLELPQAGHWLHTDDPDGLLDLLVTRL
jgi:pimeloyl-ACP methyl ester carboxylesterase